MANLDERLDAHEEIIGLSGHLFAVPWKKA